MLEEIETKGVHAHVFVYVHMCIHIHVGICLASPEWLGKTDMINFIDHASQRDSQNQLFWQPLTAFSSDTVICPSLTMVAKGYQNA